MPQGWLRRERRTGRVCRPVRRFLVALDDGFAHHLASRLPHSHPSQRRTTGTAAPGNTTTPGREEDVPDEDVDSVGQFDNTLMTGLITQWVFDPATPPNAEQLTEGLRRVAGASAEAGNSSS